MALIATPGGSTSNAYCTVAEAIPLLTPMIRQANLLEGTVMVGLEEGLIWATRLLEESVAWYGTPVSETQALSWPQAGIYTPRGLLLSATTIPDFLKQATADYALALVEGMARRATTLASLDTLQGLKSLTIADVRMETAGGITMAETHMAAIVRMPADVRRQVRPYGDVAGDITVSLRAR
jgi:hypothetical protein